MQLKYINLEEVDSTNDYVKRNADLLEDGTVVTAKRQTLGRGRMGRSFLSPEGGAYMTLLLKRVKKEIVEFITPMVAVAVAEAIEPFTLGKVQIKWVNDVLINGKKVCGILCESKYSCGEAEYVAVGIGINVNLPNGGFDKEIKETATSITETQNSNLIQEIIISVTNKFIKSYENFDAVQIVERYRKRDCLTGKTVTIRIGENTIEGEAVGINDKCNLIVKTIDGIKTVLSGTLH